jgi:hypothetical protein
VLIFGNTVEKPTIFDIIGFSLPGDFLPSATQPGPGSGRAAPIVTRREDAGGPGTDDKTPSVKPTCRLSAHLVGDIVEFPLPHFR